MHENYIQIFLFIFSKFIWHCITIQMSFYFYLIFQYTNEMVFLLMWFVSSYCMPSKYFLTTLEIQDSECCFTISLPLRVWWLNFFTTLLQLMQILSKRSKCIYHFTLNTHVNIAFLHFVKFLQLLDYFLAQALFFVYASSLSYLLYLHFNHPNFLCVLWLVSNLLKYAFLLQLLKQDWYSH